jgi:hypothetical protein
VAFGTFESAAPGLDASIEACRKAAAACEKRKQAKGGAAHYPPKAPWYVGEDPLYDAPSFVVDGRWMLITDAYRLYAKHQLDRGLDPVAWNTFERDVYRDHIRHKNRGKRCLAHIESLNLYLRSKGRDGDEVLVLPFDDETHDVKASMEDTLALCLEFVDILRVTVPQGMNNIEECERLYLASRTAHAILGTKLTAADILDIRERARRLHGNT